MLPLIKGQMSELCVSLFVWVWVFPLGGAPSTICVSVSDFLSNCPTLRGVSQSGTATLDVWKTTEHFLQVHTHTHNREYFKGKA